MTEHDWSGRVVARARAPLFGMPAGVYIDTPVWMGSARPQVLAHGINAAGDRTPCASGVIVYRTAAGQLARLGTVLPAVTAWGMGAVWCQRCWPATPTTALLPRRRGDHHA